MLPAKEFIEVMIEELRDLGWSRKGKSLWVRGIDGDVVVDLQKSNYDQTVFINVGVMLHELRRAEFPKYADCHLQFRVERLVADFPDVRIDNAEELREALRPKEPVLRALGDLADLRRRATEGGLAGGLVRREAREMLASKASKRT